MRKLLLTLAAVCALASSRPVSAGDPHQPGDTCVPTPEAPCPEGGGTQSSTTPPFVIVLVNGVPTVIWL